MIVDLDLFHEMSLYRQAVNEGKMPLEDAFAYTPTNNPVVHHEWATGAFLYFICVTLSCGATGLIVTKYLLTFGVGLGCWWYAKRNGASLAMFAVLVPVALNVGGWMAFTNIRAQLFTLFFLMILMLLLDLDRRGNRWWIAVWLPLVVVWGNFHGGVVSGIGLIGCYGVARVIESWLETRSIVSAFKKIQHLVWTGLATAGLLNVSPYGWDYVPYLIRAIRMPRQLIPEWNAIWNLNDHQPLLFFLISLGIALFAVALQNRRLRDEHASGDLGDSGDVAASHRRPFWAQDLFTPFALALTAYMAAKHYRHGSLYAVTWLCLVPPLFMGTPISTAVNQIWAKREKLIGATAIAITVVCLGLSFRAEFWQLRVPAQKAYAQEPILVYPVGPAQFLADHQFEGNVFVPFNLGAYLSWKLYPNVKVSIDSRYEVAYPHGALEENFRFYNALDDWQATVDKYATDAFLIPRQSRIAEPLAQLFSAPMQESNLSHPPVQTASHRSVQLNVHPSDDSQEFVLYYEDQEFLLYVRANKTQQFGLKYRDWRKRKIDSVFP